MLPLLQSGAAADLRSERPWVFVTPTYAWRLPRLVRDLIRGGRFSGSRDAYFVMTCGGDIGNASPKNRALCEGKGLRCRGTLEVVMPENYIALFDAPEQDEAKKIIAAAQPTLERGVAVIREGREFPEKKVDFSGKLKSGIVNTVFYRFVIKAKPFTATDACVGCGKCEKACPLGNIQMKDGKPIWGDRCTHCMACICGCPTEAIEYGKASKGKPRYQCPGVQNPRVTWKSQRNWFAT